MKNSEISIKTKVTPASLPIQGQVTKHTTVKWTICRQQSILLLANAHALERRKLYVKTLFFKSHLCISWLYKPALVERRNTNIFGSPLNLSIRLCLLWERKTCTLLKKSISLSIAFLLQGAGRWFTSVNERSTVELTFLPTGRSEKLYTVQIIISYCSFSSVSVEG